MSRKNNNQKKAGEVGANTKKKGQKNAIRQKGIHESAQKSCVFDELNRPLSGQAF